MSASLISLTGMLINYFIAKSFLLLSNTAEIVLEGPLTVSIRVCEATVQRKRQQQRKVTVMDMVYSCDENLSPFRMERRISHVTIGMLGGGDGFQHR
jgi:hypothetical protein